MRECPQYPFQTTPGGADPPTFPAARANSKVLVSRIKVFVLRPLRRGKTCIPLRYGFFYFSRMRRHRAIAKPAQCHHIKRKKKPEPATFHAQYATATATSPLGTTPRKLPSPHFSREGAHRTYRKKSQPVAALRKKRKKL